MLELDDSQGKRYCGNKRPLDVAIERKDALTAITLFSFHAPSLDRSTPLFVKIYQKFKDEASLRNIIQAALNAGVDYNQVYMPGYSYGIDAFYLAANEKNEAFISVLRDEIKKRNFTLVSRYAMVSCPDYTRDDLSKWKAWLEDTESSRLLKKYGVEVDLRIIETSGCD